MKKQIVLTIVLATALILLGGTAAWALPPLPSSFWGTVTVGGANVPDGTVVSAWIDGTQYAQTTTSTWGGDSVFTIDVPGDDSDTPEIEGGVEGDVIAFKIDGQVADQTGTWHRGTNVELNLTVSPDGPTAGFNHTAAGSLARSFQDTSIPGSAPIDTRGWEFGDGSTSADQNPTYTYDAAGTYTVTLTVTDTNGLSDDVSKAVVVSPVEELIMRVSTLTQTVGVGITTTADIVVENVTDPLPYAFSFVLDYNPLVTVTQITAGPDWQSGFVAWKEVNTTTHQARLDVTLLGDSTGGDVLATITFNGVQSGTVPLILSASELWDRQSQEIPHGVQNGEITVVDVLHVTGVCRLQARMDYTGCTVEVGSASDTTNSLGQYGVYVLAGTHIVTASMPGYLCANTSTSGVAGETNALPEVELRAGDVNGDCIVNALDLAAIGGCYGELSSCNPITDFNDDGAITMPDLLAAAVNYLRECPQPWDLMP